MKAKADRKPAKICGDCVHVWACSAQCGGSLQNTDASGCSIYERYSIDNDPEMLKAKIKKLEEELLKEQEPVKPDYGGILAIGTWWYNCGACKKPINAKDRFCRYCGRAVKWE